LVSLWQDQGGGRAGHRDDDPDAGLAGHDVGHLQRAAWLIHGFGDLRQTRLLGDLGSAGAAGLRGGPWFVQGEDEGEGLVGACLITPRASGTAGASPAAPAVGDSPGAASKKPRTSLASSARLSVRR
jgi:hypothetical protein